MEMYLVITIIVGYLFGSKGKKGYVLTIDQLKSNIAEQNSKITGQESLITEKINAIMTLTAERDVQKTNAENYTHQLVSQKEGYERQIDTLKSESEKALQEESRRGQRLLDEQKASFEKQIND